MSKAMTINLNFAEMEYAVRGPIPQRAAEMARLGQQTIPCNIGNPQALGQEPITFYRQVLSLLEEPARIGRERTLSRLMTDSSEALAGLTREDLPSDHVLDLCEEILRQLPTGLGAYTESKGPLFIRQAVAEYIDRRDGVAAGSSTASDPESIFLTNGASEAARNIIDILISGPRDGIMIPIPQYPLYSAAIRRAGGVQVNYYPDEESGWTMDRAMLEESIAGARAQGVTVKAVVVINPANPTGAILPRESVADLVGFAEEHGLAIIADEVYQDNLYGAEFCSFARCVGERKIPLFSLHSASKGFTGECGHRGGYVEVRHPMAIAGADISFSEVLLKQASVSLCSNTVGHLLIYLMVTPPPPGSAPHQQFTREREGILAALHQKATMIREAFSEMEGMECFGRTGAMYLFPRMSTMPAGKSDFDYCMSLLETTGLCTVNGSGFGQREGTHHLRIAFLPSHELLQQVLPRWIEFHNNFVKG